MIFPDLKKLTAYLESKVDLLETEISYLDDMLRRCGFPEGIQSLKLAVAEVLKSKESGAS
ncbi:MAG: hypothetical protein JSS09_02360 [Verrucomicrobia bacterium]|nr:hypothetical protein [Verrucomicrobiota bacterium]